MCRLVELDPGDQLRKVIATRYILHGSVVKDKKYVTSDTKFRTYRIRVIENVFYEIFFSHTKFNTFY